MIFAESILIVTFFHLVAPHPHHEYSTRKNEESDDSPWNYNGAATDRSTLLLDLNTNVSHLHPSEAKSSPDPLIKLSPYEQQQHHSDQTSPTDLMSNEAVVTNDQHHQQQHSPAEAKHVDLASPAKDEQLPSPVKDNEKIQSPTRDEEPEVIPSPVVEHKEEHLAAQPPAEDIPSPIEEIHMDDIHSLSAAPAHEDEHQSTGAAAPADQIHSPIKEEEHQPHHDIPSATKHDEPEEVLSSPKDEQRTSSFVHFDEPKEHPVAAAPHTSAHEEPEQHVQDDMTKEEEVRLLTQASHEFDQAAQELAEKLDQVTGASPTAEPEQHAFSPTSPEPAAVDKELKSPVADEKAPTPSVQTPVKEEQPTAASQTPVKEEEPIVAAAEAPKTPVKEEAAATTPKLDSTLPIPPSPSAPAAASPSAPSSAKKTPGAASATKSTPVSKGKPASATAASASKSTDHKPAAAAASATKTTEHKPAAAKAPTTSAAAAATTSRLAAPRKPPASAPTASGTASAVPKPKPSVPASPGHEASATAKPAVKILNFFSNIKTNDVCSLARSACETFDQRCLRLERIDNGKTETSTGSSSSFWSTFHHQTNTSTQNNSTFNFAQTCRKRCSSGFIRSTYYYSFNCPYGRGSCCFGIDDE